MANSSWMTMRVLSNHENKIKAHLDVMIRRNGWDHIILRAIVPMEKYVVKRQGKNMTRERNFYPGYMFLEVNPELFSSDIQDEIRTITGISKILGSVRDDEVKWILSKIDEAEASLAVSDETYVVGESVRITEGAFVDFEGRITDINDERKRLEVVVSIFGRDQPVELGFNQVNKL